MDSLIELFDDITYKEHNCVERSVIDQRDLDLSNHIQYGNNIGKIIYLDDIDKWIATNYEYSTIINYCPFCGLRLC